jgi:hypothetical protein
MTVMKKTWIGIPAALALTLAGCGGDYPGQAMLGLETERPEGVTLSGVVLEMNSGVKDKLPRFESMRQEIRAYMEAPNEVSLSFWGDLSSERKTRIEALRDEHAEAMATRMRQYEEWQATTTATLEAARAEQEKVNAEWERYQSFISEAEARLVAVTEKIKEAEARQVAINNEVRDYTNKRIIDEQLAVRQLNPRSGVLSWSSTRWRDGVDISELSCTPRDNRVTLDLTAEDRSCVYIQYPVAQLANEEYDEILRKATLEYLHLNRDIGKNSSWNSPGSGLRGELQEARTGVQNAQILAENQTGTTARNLTTQRSQLSRRIEQTENQLNEAAERLAEGEFAFFLPVDRNLGRQTGNELRNILDQHLAESINAQIERSIIKRSEIDNDGNAKGLSRKGDYVIAVVDATETNRFGRPSVEHIVALQDVSSKEPKVQDKKLVIELDNSMFGSGSYEVEGRLNELIYHLFSRL